MSGYIKLHRGWHDSEFFRPEPYCERAAWAWLLSHAAWKEVTRRTGQGGTVTLQRGEIHVSLSSLASAWMWSIKRVRGFIDRLEKGHMVGTKKGKAGTVLTITNYNKYQGGDDAEGTPEGTQKGTVRAQSGHTQEEGKEVKEGKNTSYAFFGRTIRLNANDLERWRKRYHRVQDIEAELGALDDWLSGQDEKARKGWFHIASGSLNKKHQAAARESDVEIAHEFTGPC